MGSDTGMLNGSGVVCAFVAEWFLPNFELAAMSQNDKDSSLKMIPYGIMLLR